MKTNRSSHPLKDKLSLARQVGIEQSKIGPFFNKFLFTLKSENAHAQYQKYQKVAHLQLHTII